MNKKILNIEELKEVLNIIRNKKNENQKIVFTNGCFDILHRGHVEYLQKARELGDLLILGLNSDLSVKKLKGENRPINNEEDRAIVLSALESVDYIIIFNEDIGYICGFETEEIQDKIEERKIAKQNKDYALSDTIRDELLSKGIELIDTREGTTYKIK